MRVIADCERRKRVLTYYTGRSINFEMISLKDIRFFSILEILSLKYCAKKFNFSSEAASSHGLISITVEIVNSFHNAVINFLTKFKIPIDAKNAIQALIMVADRYKKCIEMVE